MNASEVKKGDRVVFAIGEKQFNGISLSDAKISAHPGVKRVGIYLDIVYLDESGASVKVLSAPLLKDAVEADDLEKIVEIEHASRSRDHRRSSLEVFGGDVTLDDLRKEFRELKQTSGWKPFAEAPDVEALKAELASATAENDTLRQERNSLESTMFALQSELKAELATATAENDTLKQERAGLESAVLGLETQLKDATVENDTLKAANAELQQRLDSAAKVALSETPLIQAGLAAGALPSPSAEDLDAAAAEQQAADATATANTAPENN